jgi:hypothetical protein
MVARAIFDHNTIKCSPSKKYHYHSVEEKDPLKYSKDHP